MTVIWKAILQPVEVQQIMVPTGAEMLCAREQFEQICVWFRCDPSAPLSARTLAVVGTGNPAPDGGGRYLGTASLRGGQLIFHVFEQTRPV
jgi:hypothetical protein